VYQYDPAGNLTGAGGRGYTYAGSGRLRMGLTGGALTGYYRYAHTGLRLQKFSWATGWRVHHYAPDSKLLQETTDTGSLVRAYVWDDEVPIAQIDRDPTTGQETLTYLHTDYLGTPRLATNSQQAVVWRWEGNAFGETPPSGSITVNLRFAGQYYDAETGLHYNWHRYYDPRIGRYITADPRGVRKHVHFAFVQMQATQASATKYGYLNTTRQRPPLELNPYAYVAGNPLRWLDPRGLQAICTLALASTGDQKIERPECEIPIPGQPLDPDPDSRTCYEGCQTAYAFKVRDCYKGCGGPLSAQTSACILLWKERLQQCIGDCS
jgi:RHS repeat-associated protein